MGTITKELALTDLATNNIEVTNPAGMWFILIYIILFIHLYLDTEISLDELQDASKIIGRFYSWTCTTMSCF